MAATPKRAVRLIGAPVDLADGIGGAYLGPSALRRAGLADRLELLGYTVEDAGDVGAPTPEATEGPGDPSARYLADLIPVLEALTGTVRRARRQGRIPLVLGGNNSIALATVSGMTGDGDLASGNGGRTAALGMLWVDAHGDANTPETSPSGNLNGMPVAALFGRGRGEYTSVGGFAPGASRLRPENTALIGVRSVDEGEDENLAEIGVRVFTMEEVDRRGMAAVAAEALMRALDGTEGFHLNIDMDALDPEAAPGVSYPVPGGLALGEARVLMEEVALSGGLRSLDLGELNPLRDTGNRTAHAAAELIAAAFGGTTPPRPH